MLYKRIKQIMIVAIIIVSSVIFSPFVTKSSASRFINFQGRLTDQQGNALEGTYNIFFSIYASATDTDPLWIEEHTDVSVSKGLVNVLLGSIQSLDSPIEVTFDQKRYLGIRIDCDHNPVTKEPEMLPRQLILPAIYAYNADRLDGKDSSDYTTPQTDAGRPGVTQNLYEGNIRLTDKYLEKEVGGDINPDADETDQGLATFGGVSTVKDFVDAIGLTSQDTIVLKRGNSGDTTVYTFSTSETIPSNIKLIIAQGAVITINTGVTLTIEGELDAGLYKIFNLVGTGTVTGVTNIKAEWFGFTGTSDQNPLNLAIISANSNTNGGTITINTPINIDSSILPLSNTILNFAWKSSKVTSTCGAGVPAFKIGTNASEYSHVTINNLYLDTSGANTTSIGIWKRSCGHFTMTNSNLIGVAGSSQIGILCGNGTHGRFSQVKMLSYKYPLYLDNPSGQECHDTLFDHLWLYVNDVAGAYGVWSGDYSSVGTSGHNAVVFLYPYVEGGGASASGYGSSGETDPWTLICPRLDGTFLQYFAPGSTNNEWMILAGGDENFTDICDYIPKGISFSRRATQIYKNFRIMSSAGNQVFLFDSDGLLIDQNTNLRGAVIRSIGQGAPLGTGNKTITADMLLWGVIHQDPNGNANWTTDTAVNIVAAIPNVEVGSSFEVWLFNEASAASGEIVTILAGVGVSLCGNTNTLTEGINTTAKLLFRVTDIGSGTEAVICYILTGI